MVDSEMFCHGEKLHWENCCSQDESTYYNENVNRNVRQHSREELMTVVKSDDEEGSTYEQFDNKLTVKPINCSSESASRCASVIQRRIFILWSNTRNMEPNCNR